MKILNPKKYLDLYDQERYLFENIGPIARKRGFIKFEEFYKICMWKSARQKPKYLENRKLVESISMDAFKKLDEKEKIQKLCTLNGVGIPVASALLTVIYPDQYGIIDVRCVEMLREKGFAVNKNMNISTWITYLFIIREIARKNNLIPREVDKILFAMHKEMLEKKDYVNLYFEKKD